VAFLNRFLAHERIQGHIETINLASQIPNNKIDVALLLKTLPCLEQLDKTINTRLLREINAPVLVVSFPTASLGGKGKGMEQYYDQHFRELLDTTWSIEKLLFPTEMVFYREEMTASKSNLYDPSQIVAAIQHSSKYKDTGIPAETILDIFQKELDHWTDPKNHWKLPAENCTMLLPFIWESLSMNSHRLD